MKGVWGPFLFYLQHIYNNVAKELMNYSYSFNQQTVCEK